MYTQSENLQVLQSQRLIANALFSLMKSYPYNDITITQICQEAKVVRQTFYRNFKTKADILEYSFDHMFQHYISDYYKPGIDIYQHLKIFFDYIIQHKEYLILIEKNDLFFYFSKLLTRNIRYFSNTEFTHILRDPKLDIYVFGYITSTICSILSIWIQTNFEQPTDMLAKLSSVFFSGLKTSMDF